VTDLGLSASSVGDDRALLGRVKWSMVVPWVVSALLFGSEAYHRFLSVETDRSRDAASIVELRREVQEQNSRIGAMQSDMAVMRAILERVEAQQQRERRR